MQAKAGQLDMNLRETTKTTHGRAIFVSVALWPCSKITRHSNCKPGKSVRLPFALTPSEDVLSPIFRNYLN